MEKEIGKQKSETKKPSKDKMSKGIKATKKAKSSALATMASAPTHGLSRKQVMDYLTNHPSFFSGKDAKTKEVLLQMQIPHEETFNTISLLEYQNSLWREKAEQIEMLHKTLLSDIKYNQDLVGRINKATLDLLMAKDLQTVCKVLEKIFKEDFTVTSYKLMLFGKLPKSKHYNLWEKSSLPRELTDILDRKELTYGSFSPLVQELFFDKEKNKWASYLLAPLYAKKRIYGVICLTSQEEFRFSQDLLTDYIDFLFATIRITLDQHQNKK